MHCAKRFLIWFFVAYCVIAVGATFVLGGPNLSRAYLDKFQHEHDHYIEIIKSDAYKLYRERPSLHPPDEALRQKIEFVEEYEQRPKYLAEKRRLAIRSHFYDLFNVLAVVILAVRFGRKPLLDFLDAQVAQIRKRIERAEQAQAEATQRLADAEAKMDGLDAEKKLVASQAQELAEVETQSVAQATEELLAQIRDETEIRKRLEERRAAMLLKQYLVTESIKLLEQRLKEADSQERQKILINQFVHYLDQAGSMAQEGAAERGGAI